MDDDFDEAPELVELQTDTNKVIPITILSGFLGSGKTTLLNKILTGSHGLRIAVIENEFSEGLGIEGMIAKSGINGDNISNFFELNNGCVSFVNYVPPHATFIEIIPIIMYRYVARLKIVFFRHWNSW